MFSKEKKLKYYSILIYNFSYNNHSLYEVSNILQVMMRFLWVKLFKFVIIFYFLYYLFNSFLLTSYFLFSSSFFLLFFNRFFFFINFFSFNLNDYFLFFLFIFNSLLLGKGLLLEIQISITFLLKFLSKCIILSNCSYFIH